VKHSVRASVETYSIKDLEPFYGFTRHVALGDARTNLRVIERALELCALAAITDEVRGAVEGYNRDDCFSALRLRDWLEQLRGSIEAGGTLVPRPEPKDGIVPEKLDDRARRVQALMTALISDISAERAERNGEQQGRWLLAHLLDWHRREAKAPWWEFFRLRDLSDDELLAEKAALSGLQFIARVGGTTKSPVDRYSYPRQDTEVRDGDALHLPDGTNFGSVATIDRVARMVDVKKRSSQADVHPAALFAHSVVNSDVLADALLRMADDVAQHGISGGTQFRAARELLLNRPPRLRSGAFEAQPGESAVQFAIRIAADLDHTVLAIQGPPGAGKTFTGAQMICELVRRGARVGITAVSHKAIRTLLDATVKAASEFRLPMTCIHKVTTKGDPPSTIEEPTDNAETLARLRDGRANVVGGTQWLWARPDAQGAADVLFVDEAGQMSLANVLAASQGAASVVLLGDPQQLEQPQQGTHPEGADVSALEHILQDHRFLTIGEFSCLRPGALRQASASSRRKCSTRESSGRALDSKDKCSLERHRSKERDYGWPQSRTQETKTRLANDKIVTGLLRPEAQWVDCHGAPHRMTSDAILIVAPYNSQVSLLSERLAPRGVRVGTVDRFQGQEAPVVIYSMATSTPEDAPRGMEFLYNLNRLNVATSRAKCASILVASLRPVEPECKSSRQMRLANALCRYVELSRPVTLN
jgi:hypothetical protein